jgi:hypothetical protein
MSVRFPLISPCNCDVRVSKETHVSTAGKCMLLKVRGFFRLRKVNIVDFTIYLIATCFGSYDHLQAEIYLLESTLLTTDPLFVEY